MKEEEIVKTLGQATLPGASTLLLVVLLAGCSTGTDEGSGTPESGASSTATATLPHDFPRTDVPLVGGTVVAATGSAATGWSVTIMPSDKDGLARAKQLLVKAGYSAQSTESDAFTGPKYDVLTHSTNVSVTYAVSAD